MRSNSAQNSTGSGRLRSTAEPNTCDLKHRHDGVATGWNSDGMDIGEISELATAWCRMWNEDSALAHELMTDDCVQWFAARRRPRPAIAGDPGVELGRDDGLRSAPVIDHRCT